MSAQQASFAEFYASSRDDCLRAVFASTGDRLAAEEYVAEAFARAWASWRKVSVHPMPRAWVIRTALNLSVSAWRRRRREILLREPGDAGSRPASWEAVPDSALMTVLAGLPLRQRQVVALRVFLDLDTAATASALGIAPGTVTAHLARADIRAARAADPRVPGGNAMTDDDLLESIRSQFADVRLGAPLDEVLARGRELRRNGRWLPAMGAGAGTFATVAALTFATAGGGQAPMLHASLTAWAVSPGLTARSA